MKHIILKKSDKGIDETPNAPQIPSQLDRIESTLEEILEVLKK